MQRDLEIYLPAMEKQLNILDTLYEEHGLESDEVVWASAKANSGIVFNIAFFQKAISVSLYFFTLEREGTQSFIFYTFFKRKSAYLF